MTPRAVFLTRAVAAAALWLASGAAAFACPICFQLDDGPTSSGVKAAVVVLMAVTVGVLSGFGVFIRNFVRRSRREAVQ